MENYYFITYQAINRGGSISIWNQVTMQSPMAFIKEVERVERESSDTYRNFVVLNTCVISKEDYEKFHNEF
jgi:hypothetical protein